MSDYKLEEVFKLSGVPDATFVEPVEFERLLVALRTRGRGVVIEGPSGIGKTSAAAKAIDRLAADLGTDTLTLSARRKDDRELIAELPTIGDAGVVVIDDFHRLDAALRVEIADHLKVLADEEREDTMIVIIGINRAGESLLSVALIWEGELTSSSSA
jgi:ATP/maltotriose-dependent transcriptional regulator MalT